MSDDKKDKRFPCPLCGENIPVLDLRRWTVKGLSICEGCTTQLFESGEYEWMFESLVNGQP
jgi:transcription elongation factor Elf1